MLRVFDLNADGADDIIVIDSQPTGNFMHGIVDVVFGGIITMGQKLCAPLSCRAPHLFEAAWDPSQFGLEPAVWFADLDGDGLSEFVFAVTIQGFTFLHYKRNFGPTVGANGDVIPLTLSQAMPMDTLGEGGASMADVDGDGATDAIYAAYLAPEWIWTGASSFPSGATALRRETGLMNGRLMQRQQWLADLNGDGLVDALEVPERGGDLTIAYNSGNGFEPNTTFNTWLMPANKVSGAWADNGVRFVDVDGDGLTEVLQMTGPGGRANLAMMSARSARNGALASVSVLADSDLIVSGDRTSTGYPGSQVLDANGDGLSDLAQIENGALQLYISKGERRHLLKAVTNGLGERLEVSRAPMSDTSRVKRNGCAPAGKEICSTKGKSVVVEIRRTSSSPGQSAVTTFGYDTPVYDVRGRRFVGFQKRTSELPGGSGKVTETYDLTRVNSYYPLAAKPSTVVHDVVLSPTLARRTTTTNLYRLHPNADPWWVELLLTEVVDHEFDPTVVTSPGSAEMIRRSTRAFTVYDDYGNVTTSVYATDDGWSGTTVLDVPIDRGNWYVRNIASMAQTSRSPSGESQTRVVETTYVNGLVKTVTVEPNGDCD